MWVVLSLCALCILPLFLLTCSLRSLHSLRSPCLSVTHSLHTLRSRCLCVLHSLTLFDFFSHSHHSLLTLSSLSLSLCSSLTLIIALSLLHALHATRYIRRCDDFHSAALFSSHSSSCSRHKLYYCDPQLFTLIGIKRCDDFHNAVGFSSPSTRTVTDCATSNDSIH